jgi:hypothetical protein
MWHEIVAKAIPLLLLDTPCGNVLRPVLVRECPKHRSDVCSCIHGQVLRDGIRTMPPGAFTGAIGHVVRQARGTQGMRPEWAVILLLACEEYDDEKTALFLSAILSELAERSRPEADTDGDRRGEVRTGR